MSYERYINLSPQLVLDEYSQNIETGYSQSKIPQLQKRYGKNLLVKDQVTWWHIFLRQFKSAFIYVLIVAALITFALGETIDSIFILFFIGINVFLGFFQEHKSEQTARLLKKYTNKRATVVRDGEEKVIDASDLVPGDVVIVETGDIVPADIRLVKSASLMTDESALTGESVQIAKDEKVLSSPIKDIFNVTNTVFSGTVVTEGWGVGVVVGIGGDTQFGKISKLVTQVEESSSFERRINKFSKFVLVLTLITLSLVFIVHLFLRDTLSIAELMIYSIALAVGVIPEAMPLVTTFSLSLGAQKLAKKKVIVKRLSALEDLGGIQILCTDKTGTITENRLSVANVFSSNKEETLLYGLMAASSLNGEGTSNNSFDLAIMNAMGSKAKSVVNKIKKINQIPFNPSRRRNSVLIESSYGREIIVRGATEAVLPFTENQYGEDSELARWIVAEGELGRRVIAIAKKRFSKDTYNVSDEESKLVFVGAISFEDPVKSTTKGAIQKARELGVTTKIITGDSAEVAVAVGMKIGIAETTGDVITGEMLFSLSKNEQKEVVKKLNVFARVSPEQKHNLIKLLQEDYEVGFLGEGINDGPALKAAGVSIVVDNASDVSREVADIILLKHDLKVIVDGIEQGRKIFINVTNYVKATLASNFGNFYAMAFVTLIIDYLPMLPIQILLVNLLSDFPMLSIATDNVDRKNILNPKSYDIKELIYLTTILGLVSTVFDFAMFRVFSSYGERTLHTYWFMGSILTELMLIYSIRTKEWFFKIKTLPSKAMLLLTVLASFLTVYIPFTTFGAEVFKFTYPTRDKLLIIFFIVVGYFASTEFVKRIWYRFMNDAH